MSAVITKKPGKAKPASPALMTLAEATQAARADLSRAVKLTTSAEDAADPGNMLARTLRIAQDIAEEVAGWMDRGQHDRFGWMDRLYDLQGLLVCAAAYNENPASSLAAKAAAQAIERAMEILDQPHLGMNTATIERRRTSAGTKNPGDHRASAIATVREITEQAASVWGSADGMVEHAWELLNTAAGLGEKIVERNHPTVAFHAGGLASSIGDFHAALHGVRALIMEMAEKDWTADDVAAMDMIRTAGPQLRAVLENLERQRHWEVDLGNKPADAPIAQVASTAPDENTHFLVDQAIAVFQSAAMQDATCDVMLALRNLALFCGQRVDQALGDHQTGSYDEASLALSAMIDLVDVLDAEKAGGTLLYAARSLLQLAKTEIDAQGNALEQAEMEAAHA